MGVNDEHIEAVATAKPAGTRVHETHGVILPGLLDMHNHPEFNIFAAWEPPQLFANRYRWRGSDIYHKLVRDPRPGGRRDRHPGRIRQGPQPGGGAGTERRSPDFRRAARPSHDRPAEQK